MKKYLQRCGGIVDGVRAEGENCTVEEVKHRHLILIFWDDKHHFTFLFLFLFLNSNRSYNVFSYASSLIKFFYLAILFYSD